MASCTAFDRPKDNPSIAINSTPTTKALSTADDPPAQQPQDLASAAAASAAAASAAAHATASETQTARLAPPVNDDPQQLLGLSGNDVTGRLGTPVLVRRDGPAEIWQYKATACILDVFLYTTADGQRVRYVELRGRDASTEPQRQCFVSLLGAK